MPRKISESDALASAAKDSGDAAFAEELRGLSLEYQKKPSAAIDAFSEAIKLGDPSPDLQLTYALTQKDAGNESRFEQILWKLVSDRPGYERAFTELFDYYDAMHADAQERKVVGVWRSARSFKRPRSAL